MLLFFRIALHLSCAAPLIWLYWAIPAGAFGGDPVKELIHFLGIGAIRLLILTLAVSPFAKTFKVGQILKLRRALGLWCFTWASLHFATWLSLDLAFDWALIGSELVKRTYIVLGFSAWLILLVLAVTSLPKLVRMLGRRWKKIHGWIYIASLIVCIHFWWSVKSGWIEPLIYLLITVALLSYRKRKLFVAFN